MNVNSVPEVQILSAPPKKKFAPKVQASFMICILEKRNYLSVDPSASDSRALCISATPKAYDFFKKNKSMGYALLHQMFDCINDDELETTLRVLQKMQSNLQNATKKEE